MGNVAPFSTLPPDLASPELRAGDCGRHWTARGGCAERPQGALSPSFSLFEAPRSSTRELWTAQSSAVSHLRGTRVGFRSFKNK